MFLLILTGEEIVETFCERKTVKKLIKKEFRDKKLIKIKTMKREAIR